MEGPGSPGLFHILATSCQDARIMTQRTLTFTRSMPFLEILAFIGLILVGFHG
jgi:hypothetical protein